MVNREYIENIEFEQGVTIAKLTGSVTFENLEAVQKEFRAKTKGANIKNIIFDLKDISATDSSAIAALVELLKYMKTHRTGNKIGLINFSPKIKDLIEILKTDPLFMEFQSRQEAVANLQ